MATIDVSCIKDLTGIVQAMQAGGTGVLSFVGTQAVLTTVADDETVVVVFKDGVATPVTPLEGTTEVLATSAMTFIDGILTAVTPA